MLLCRLRENDIGDTGAAAIGAGLVHLPQLQKLKYDVCPAVGAGAWCALARECWAMGESFALSLCVRLAFGQPCFQ